MFTEPLRHPTDAVGLVAAVEAHLARPLDELDEPAIRAEMAVNERLVRQLSARNAHAAETLVRRQARRIQDANPSDHRAGDKAARQVTDELRRDLQWSPSKTKQAVRTARQLGTSGPTRDAYRAGELTGDHARVLADTLRHLDRNDRDEVEPGLVEAARTQDAVAFGRTCRARLADLDAAAAEQAAARRHQRRYGRTSQDPDGILRLSAGFAGLDAEFVATAIEAYRTTDTVAGQSRTAEQRTADAIVAMARASLDHGRPATAHGQRPHVVVHLTWADLVAGTGNADTTWTGPIPTSEIRRLLDDCSISRVITGPDSLPIDTGRATRNITTGTWRTIVDRDRTCTVPGCDAPPSRCQAVHLDRRWIEGAGISPHEVALGCYDHHPVIDRQHWTGRIIDGQVVWENPGHDPAARSP